MQLSEIKKNPSNPRLIRDARFDALKRSLQDFPQMMVLRPLVVDADGVVLGGNMRLEALKALGFKEVPDEWVRRADELTPEQKREFVIKDNSSFGEYDWDLLANEWSDLPLSDWGVDLPEDWLTQNGVEEDESQVSELIDKAAELQQKWQVVTGGIYQIGRHRLMCGDSTKVRHVKALLGHSKPLPALMVTDPPYGVGYVPAWRDGVVGEFGNGAREKNAVQNDDILDWSDAFMLSPAHVAYVWHAGRFASEVATQLIAQKFEIRNQIIWAKQHFAISRGSYHWQHEPCWYAVRKGQRSGWKGDRTQSTLWEISSLNPAGRQEERFAHGTQKPLECMARPIRNHEGDVYDPFIGSGTTMVAAEQEGRICYGMDIEPKYVAVTLERMAALGINAESKQ